MGRAEQVLFLSQPSKSKPRRKALAPEASSEVPLLFNGDAKMARAAPAVGLPSDPHRVDPVSHSAQDKVPEADADLLSFFPATQPDFVCRAGAVTPVRKEDFENEHRARHLRSFQRSMREWGDFNPDVRNCIDPEVTTQFTLRLLSRNPQTADEFNQICAELRKAFKAAPSKAQIIASYEALLANSSERPDSFGFEAEVHDNEARTQSSSDASCSSKVGPSNTAKLRRAEAGEAEKNGKRSCGHTGASSLGKGEEQASEATTCGLRGAETGDNCCSAAEGDRDHGSSFESLLLPTADSLGENIGSRAASEIALYSASVGAPEAEHRTSLGVLAFPSPERSPVPLSSDTTRQFSGRPLFRRNRVLENLMKRKAIRTNSGVLVITVLTSPGRFSCPQDCHYCPNEPGQPRSYLSTEPAVLRANQNGWDAVRQFHDRASTLQGNGHTVDKIEVLVLGGTWSG